MRQIRWGGVLDRPRPSSISGAWAFRPNMEMTMTPQERQMLADLFERVRTAAASPRDPEAEAFIGDAVRAVPYSPYVLAQTTLVQQHALEAAAHRISELETRLSQSESAPAETSFLGNLGKSLFGGGAAAPPSPPRPGYDASGYQRGAPAPDPAGYREQGYAPPPRHRRAAVFSPVR